MIARIGRVKKIAGVPPSEPARLTELCGIK